MKKLGVECGKNKKGITLVALIVTIVVLLILAGVSLNLLVGNNGVLMKTKNAVDKYSEQSTNEQQDLKNIESWMKSEFGEIIKVTVNTKATKNGTINGEEPNTNNPIIPEGYTPIDSGNAKWGDGSITPEQSSVDNGLVIKDDNNNEWVWIPVENDMQANIFVFSTEESGEPISGNLGITTKVYSNKITIGSLNEEYEIVRVKPSNNANYREPDILTKIDRNSKYYNTILGYTSVDEMAKSFVQEYDNTINSIIKYGGFYIGRYELSNEGVQSKKESITNKNWYELYEKCTKLKASEKVESQMIWGIQWDLACDFISKKGEKKSIRNASTWANYKNSTGDAAIKLMENGQEVQKYGSKQVTGYSEYWKANNIYDLAGNCTEFTQEAASGTGFRSVRGGGYNGIGYAPYMRSNYGPDYSRDFLRFTS